MIWPQGVLLSGPGIVELVGQIIRKVTTRRAGAVVKELAGEATQVLGKTVILDSPAMRGRIASATVTADNILRNSRTLERQNVEAVAELAEGLDNITVGVDGVLPSTKESIQNFKSAITRQVVLIGEASGDMTARQALASALRAPATAAKTGLVANAQQAAIRQWTQLVRDTAAELERRLTDGIFERLGLSANESITRIMDMAVVELESATARVLSPRRVPSVETAVAEASGTIPVSSRELRQAFEFVSPNIDENIPFARARALLDSPEQARLQAIFRDVDTQMGLVTDQRPAIGDWVDGAENTVFVRVFDAPDFDTIRYSAAWKGFIANQKAVIPFIAAKGGPDSLYIVKVATTNLEQVRTQLDDAGLQFRTIIPEPDGTRVVVFDPGTQLLSNVQRFGRINGTGAEQIRGTGEFLGGQTRADGRRVFRTVIDQFESRGGARRYRPLSGPRVPSVGPPAAAPEPAAAPTPPRVTPALTPAAVQARVSQSLQEVAMQAIEQLSRPRR